MLSSTCEPKGLQRKPMIMIGWAAKQASQSHLSPPNYKFNYLLADYGGERRRGKKSLTKLRDAGCWCAGQKSFQDAAATNICGNLQLSSTGFF